MAAHPFLKAIAPVGSGTDGNRAQTRVNHSNFNLD